MMRVLFGGMVSTGGWVSGGGGGATTVILWRPVAVLLEESLTLQVRITCT
jgi:hypothetical protein